MNGLFCDHNAGAPPLDEVLAAFVDAERQGLANPASAHAAGRRARAVLEQSRERIAAAFGVRGGEVLFTSGGTEACNLAVRGLGGVALPAQVSPAEHPAVLEPAQQRGVRWWSLDAGGAVVIAEPEIPVGLLCLVHAQSELGTLQPVERALALAGELAVPLFVDAAQTLGRLPLRALAEAGAVLALSPHKAGGLRGHGVLLGRELTGRLAPLLRGGGQEFGLRPGTQSPALAAANALAIELATAQCEERAAAMHATRAAFLDGLRNSGVEHRVLTPLANSVPNTAMVHFPAVDGRSLLPALDLAGVFASHGSACSSGAPTPPRVLSAIGLVDADARACVRFSFGARDEVDACRNAGRRAGDVVLRAQKKSRGSSES